MRNEESCKGKKKKEMMTIEKNEEGRVGRRWRDPFPFFFCFFMLKKKTPVLNERLDQF
jgi:hypothetical protein